MDNMLKPLLFLFGVMCFVLGLLGGLAASIAASEEECDRLPVVLGLAGDVDGNGVYDEVPVDLKDVTVIRLDPIGNSFRFSRCILVRLDEDGKIKEYVYGPTRCERRDR